MKRYYCKKCDSELKTTRFENFEDPICPVCKHIFFDELPTYETVAQWEARTGRKYPDTAPVFALKIFCVEPEAAYWYLETCKYTLGKSKVRIVATEAGMPPGDWRPE